MDPSVIDRLKNYPGEKLPPNAGPPFNRDTKLGSWVTSGEAEYIRALTDWSEFKKYLKRWDNLAEDPTVLFYTINKLLRKNPVPIPDDLSRFLFYPKTIDPFWKPGDGIGKMGIKYDGVASLNGRFPYQGYNTLEISTARTIEDLVEGLNNIDFGIGYEYVKDFEIGNTANWNVQIYPYRKYTPMDAWKPQVSNLDSIPAFRYTLVPDLPTYLLPNLGSSVPSYHSFSYSTYCPVLSWELQMGTIENNQLDLFGGNNVAVFESFKYNMQLTLTILDDVYLSMERYMRLLMNKLYNLRTACAAPYWATLFLIPITVFRPEYKVNFQFMLICSPLSWSPNLEGSADDTGSEHRVSIDFSVVGMLNPDNIKTSAPTNNYKIGNSNMISWKDITLNPNN